MRILHIIASVDPRAGGPPAAIRELALAHAARGHDSEIVTLDDPAAAFLADWPFPVHALGPSWLNYRYNRRIVPWLRRHAGTFDVALVHGLWQYHGRAAWRALAGAPTPYFVYPHGMLDPWFKQAYPLKHLKKWLYWRCVDYRLLRDARAVLFTADEERRLARRSFTHYRCTEKVAPLGIRPPPVGPMSEAAAFRQAHPILQGKRVILFLGRITEKKACDVLIAAFADVAALDRRLHLAIVGPDDNGLVKDLRKFAEGLAINERISWVGMLEGDLKWSAYRAAELFALPSHQENFGIVVAEALACGTPVLISRKVNIWREVEAAGAGLVDDDTIAGTSRGLRRWLAMSESDREAMEARTVPCFADHFHWQRAAGRLLDVLGEAAPDILGALPGSAPPDRVAGDGAAR